MAESYCSAMHATGPDAELTQPATTTIITSSTSSMRPTRTTSAASTATSVCSEPGAAGGAADENASLSASEPAVVDLQLLEGILTAATLDNAENSIPSACSRRYSTVGVDGHGWDSFSTRQCSDKMESLEQGDAAHRTPTSTAIIIHPMYSSKLSCWDSATASTALHGGRAADRQSSCCSDASACSHGSTYGSSSDSGDTKSSSSSTSNNSSSARSDSNSSSYCSRRHHWGQALQHLGSWAEVQPGDVIGVMAVRDGPEIRFQLLDVFVPPEAAVGLAVQHGDPAAQHLEQAVHKGGAGHLQETAAVHGRRAEQRQESLEQNTTINSLDNGSSSRRRTSSSTVGVTLIRRPLHPAPLPPWKVPGRGIEDPHVWGVKKCDQLLADFLMRAPSGRFPPIWRDLQIIQVGAWSSLGQCLGAIACHDMPQQKRP